MPDSSPEFVPFPQPSGSGAVDSARALLDSLQRLGVRDVVVCPGSRSAPLVYALNDFVEQGLLRAHVRLDERAGAFTALGISRANPEHPAAVVTTSGTAVAHLLAAAMEAHHSGIPLILLTADRPAELRGTHANQTTVQPGMFAPFARFNADLPAPDAEHASSAHVRTLVSTAARAFAAATANSPGPVHLNLGFRDPLTPQDGPRGKVPCEHFALTHFQRSRPGGHALTIAPRTLVVAGDDARALTPLLKHYALPTVPEPSAQVPGQLRIPPSVLATVMKSPGHPLRPSHVIVGGHSTLSRPVQRLLLGADDLDITVVSPRSDWPDAPRRARTVIDAIDVSAVQVMDPDATAAYTQAWSDHLEEALANRGNAHGAAWQAQAALAVWDECRASATPLVVGASALIRDLEEWALTEPAAPVVANRGLAGIDGTVSMASGYALASGTRTRVLLGDVSALHDLTGLVIGPREEEPELDIIVVDDGGGRIFGSLEHVAAPASLLERFFTTPHGTNIPGAAHALGINHVREVSHRDLATTLRDAATGRRVIVVRE